MLRPFIVKVSVLGYFPLHEAGMPASLFIGEHLFWISNTL